MVHRLEIRNIKKSFGQTTVLDDIHMTFEAGKVHVLMGENGAGKSTLLKILSGIHKPDEGEILIDGHLMTFQSPMEAKQHGVSMVYQELTLLPEMTVLDNVFLGSEITYGAGLINRRLVWKQFQKILNQYGIQLNGKTLVRDLSLSRQCMAEVAKALNTDPDIILFDEATSALDPKEVESLFQIIRKLKQENKIIIFISHRMEEIFRIGDLVTVLKDGRLINTSETSAITQDELIESMVGRSIEEVFPPKCKKPGEVLLEVEHLNLKDGRLKQTSFSVRRGEIVGIAGLKGHGQGELLECIAGIRKYEGGMIRLKGRRLHQRGPKAAIRDGIILVPESRKTQALFTHHSIAWNLCSASLMRRQSFGMIRNRQQKQFVSEMAGELAVKCSSTQDTVERLSGGNQQKVVLGKILGAEPQVILFNEPTRGIDVQTKQEIYRRIRKLAEEGVCILLYSSDLLEIIGISDTVYTMYEGAVTKRLTGEDIDEVHIMRGAVGI